MNRKKDMKFSAMIIAPLIGLLLFAGPAFAATPPYRDIQSASVSNGALTASATATVAADFNSGVNSTGQLVDPSIFGYGIAFFGSNANEAIAIAIHPSVVDDAGQIPNAAAAHLHKVVLGQNFTFCDTSTGLYIASRSFDEPGTLSLSNGNKTLTINNIPLSGPLSAGSLTGGMASFYLTTQGEGLNLHICVNPDQSFQAAAAAPVGGEILGIDASALFVAGALANAGWVVPIAGATVAGLVGLIIKRRRS